MYAFHGVRDGLLLFLGLAVAAALKKREGDATDRDDCQNQEQNAAAFWH
jgi:hypothetical protein